MNFKCYLLVFISWYISECSAGHFYSGLTDDVRPDSKINDNEQHHKRIIKHPYAMYRTQPTTLKLGSDVQSTLDNAKLRVKRMNPKNEEENQNNDQQALFDEVFGTRSIDTNKLTNNDVIVDQTLQNDPDLNENIKHIFGSSDRLLAHNNLNELTSRRQDWDDKDRDIEDVASSTKKTSLNEMIFKNFGPELIDDEPEDKKDAVADQAAPDSSNSLSSNLGLLYFLFALILI